MTKHVRLGNTSGQLQGGNILDYLLEGSKSRSCLPSSCPVLPMFTSGWIKQEFGATLILTRNAFDGLFLLQT